MVQVFTKSPISGLLGAKMAYMYCKNVSIESYTNQIKAEILITFFYKGYHTIAMMQKFSNIYYSCQFFAPNVG